MATKKKEEKTVETDRTGGPICKVDLYALGQAIDDTWGRSSTSSTVDAKTAVKASVSGDTLKLTYLVVVNFNSIQQQRIVKERSNTEADMMINAKLAAIKAMYKELTGKALKAKDMSVYDDGNFEVINLGVYNTNKTAYFRKSVVYEIA